MSRKKLVAFSFQLVARDIGITDKAFLDLHRWANPDTLEQNTQYKYNTKYKAFPNFHWTQIQVE